MVYTYQEAIEIYKNDFQLKKAIANKEIFQIEEGIYSKEKNVSELEIISKKYSHGIFTLNSAFYYYGLTDDIPDLYFLKIPKNKRIKDERVFCVYENSSNINLGVCTIEYNGVKIKIYNRERLLIELIRNKKKLPFDYYKEILVNYRRIIDELDMQMIQEFAYALPKTNIIVETLQMEVL